MLKGFKYIFIKKDVFPNSMTVPYVVLSYRTWREAFPCELNDEYIAEHRADGLRFQTEGHDGWGRVKKRAPIIVSYDVPPARCEDLARHVVEALELHRISSLEQALETDKSTFLARLSVMGLGQVPRSEIQVVYGLTTSK